MEFWTGVTDASLTDSLTTLKDSATQLLIKYKNGALVTQFPPYKIVHFKLQRYIENAEKERMPAYPQNSNLTILQSTQLPPRAGDVFSTFPWWGMLPKYVNKGRP